MKIHILIQITEVREVVEEATIEAVVEEVEIETEDLSKRLLK